MPCFVRCLLYSSIFKCTIFNLNSGTKYYINQQNKIHPWEKIIANFCVITNSNYYWITIQFIGSHYTRNISIIFSVATIDRDNWQIIDNFSIWASFLWSWLFFEFKIKPIKNIYFKIKLSYKVRFLKTNFSTKPF